MAPRQSVACFGIGALAATFVSNVFNAPPAAPPPGPPTIVRVPAPCPACPSSAPPQPAKAVPGDSGVAKDATPLPPLPSGLPPPPPPPPPPALLPPPPPPPAAELPVPMTVADAGKPHLVIAMNTIPRKSGDEYLTRTLDSLKSQIHSANAPRTDVLVFDPKGNEAGNGPFAHNKQRLSGETAIHFESKQGVKDPFKGHQEPKDPNSSDIPGSVGRQHTCDIVTQLTTVIEKWPTCDYFMFMEDDFVLCDRAMEAISHVISKSDRYSPDWSALRVSFGLNGMVVPCKDLPAMRDFMFAKSSWRPADLLAVYFVGKIAEEGAAHFGEDRRVSVYRYNIMDHIGRVSTYPGRTLGSKSGAFLKCYEMMK